MSEVTTTFGIDLGTTYSCISYLKDGHPTVCLSLEGDHTTPSVVRMLPDEPEPVVGKTAKDTSILYPDDTIQFVKSKIGKVESFEIGDEDHRRSVTPVQVSAEILKKLAADASAYTGMLVKDVVITVPAYFGNNEKEATKRAGEEAGLNVIKIVEEPTASAFFYLCEKDDTDASVCVYDLGGGTFDVTAIEKRGTSISVITTEGDHDLGGKNWDAELIGLVEEKFRDATGLSSDEELDSDFLQELQIKCEEAKKQLTAAQSAQIGLKLDRQHAASITITREEFNNATSALLSTTIDLTQKVFDVVESRGKKIDKLLLVGGSSKMPQVMEAVKEVFGDKVDEILINDPDESVSKGACIFCAWSLLNMADQAADSGSGEAKVNDEATIVDKKIDDETGEVVLTIAGSGGETRDVVVPMLAGKIDKITTIATKSFGIETLKPNNPNRELQITNLIFKDQTLPADVEQTFCTSSNDQQDVSIRLYQSEIMDENYELDYGVMIGESMLEGIPAGMPAGTKFSLRIKLNEEGIIEITGSYNGAPLNGRLNTNYAEGVGRQ